MAKFFVEYREINVITREVEADSVEEAIAKSEQIRVDSEEPWEDCQEDTLGTNGVERVTDAKGVEVYNADVLTCRGCGREESVCSADPCAAVIADREATV